MRVHSDPTRQSNNHLNGARMASKAHRAKIPQEWTTWNATIGDKPKKGELNSHDPKSTSDICKEQQDNPRVRKARSDYPIAIRLSVKSQFVPDRLDRNSQARSDYPIAIRLSVKSQFVPDRLDRNSQARSDYPIAIRLSVKSQFVPDRLDEFPSQV
uniref:Uncharacterized protein n=1 Tax=Fagus sylvatica TaxID=28930 RepID=A0A2N9F9E1_FAGSY